MATENNEYVSKIKSYVKEVFNKEISDSSANSRVCLVDPLPIAHDRKKAAYLILEEYGELTLGFIPSYEIFRVEIDKEEFEKDGFEKQSEVRFTLESGWKTIEVFDEHLDDECVLRIISSAEKPQIPSARKIYLKGEATSTFNLSSGMVEQEKELIFETKENNSILEKTNVFSASLQGKNVDNYKIDNEILVESFLEINLDSFGYFWIDGIKIETPSIEQIDSWIYRAHRIKFGDHKSNCYPKCSNLVTMSYELYQQK